MTEAGNVRTLDGTTFLVCTRSGDIEPKYEEPSGLFIHDTRILSKWILTVNGERLTPLTLNEEHYFETQYFLVPGDQKVYVDTKLSVIREHVLDVGHIGFTENLLILNHHAEPVDVTIHVEVDADFADVFEVKHARPKVGTHYRRVEEGRLVLGYRRERFYRETIVSATTPAQLDDYGITIQARIEPHGRWSTQLSAVPDLPMPRGLERLDIPGRAAHTERDKEQDLQEFLRGAPRLETTWQPLLQTYMRSMTDLAALRFSPFLAENKHVPAAGLPWFMCLFGRDSIFTSLQALPFAPELAAATLSVLAYRQGSRVDDFREEEPGRILHEMRYGEMSIFDEMPHTPYFGAADSTQLFLILLDEYERWTGDTVLVRQLEAAAWEALAWIDGYADLMGNGYVSYDRRNTRDGLENQCWKDSWDAICYRDGRLPGFPRATCELQGYTYDAKMRTARLAREVWGKPVLADRLEEEAADLKLRFNRDFWIEEAGYFALALEGHTTKVDALSSNVGHLLWSGIVDDDKAGEVVRNLMSPAMFNGWGIRTLAESEARYNPIGYHVGTVWPFDNSIIAWGLRRYGYGREAARVAAGILDAAIHFDGRLPEAFGGYDRAETERPVHYPTACSPQAWSAGAPLLFMRTMLGLEPVGEHLLTNPAIPPNIEWMALLDVPGRWGHLDALGRSRGKSGTAVERRQHVLAREVSIT